MEFWIDAESDGLAKGFVAYLSNREKDGGDPYVGRKLARLLRKSGFKVEQMTASYEVVSDLLQKIGPPQAAHFSTAGCCSRQDSLMILYSLYSRGAK